MSKVSPNHNIEQDPNEVSFQKLLEIKNKQLYSCLERLKLQPDYIAYEQYLKDTIEFLKDSLENVPLASIEEVRMAIRIYRDLLDGPTITTTAASE